MFTPEATAFLVVTQEVRDALVAARVAGCAFQRLSEIELYADYVRNSPLGINHSDGGLPLCGSVCLRLRSVPTVMRRSPMPIQTQ